jgi:hypothetical protein
VDARITGVWEDLVTARYVHNGEQVPRPWWTDKIGLPTEPGDVAPLVPEAPAAPPVVVPAPTPGDPQPLAVPLAPSPKEDLARSPTQGGSAPTNVHTIGSSRNT